MWHMQTVGMIAAALVAQGVGGRAEMAMDVSRRETSAYVRAFNERKAKELGESFTRDADFVFFQGSDIERLDSGLVVGAEEIGACLARFFVLYPDARLSQTVVNARLIRPDLLIADVDFEIVGLPGELGPIRGRSVIIRLNEAGAWKIAADRNISWTRAAK
jgi:hypothetical protein